MTETFGLMVAALLVGSAAVTVIMLLLDRFLVKAFHEEKQRPRPQKPRRARKAEKKPTYSPTARPGGIVYPEEGRSHDRKKEAAAGDANTHSGKNHYYTAIVAEKERFVKCFTTESVRSAVNYFPRRK